MSTSNISFSEFSAIPAQSLPSRKRRLCLDNTDVDEGAPQKYLNAAVPSQAVPTPPSPGTLSPSFPGTSFIFISSTPADFIGGVKKTNQVMKRAIKKDSRRTNPSNAQPASPPFGSVLPSPVQLFPELPRVPVAPQTRPASVPFFLSPLEPTPFSALPSSLRPIPTSPPSAPRTLLQPSLSPSQPQVERLLDGSIIQKLPNGSIMRRYPNGKVEVTGMLTAKAMPVQTEVGKQIEEMRKEMEIKRAEFDKSMTEMRSKVLSSMVNPPKDAPKAMEEDSDIDNEDSDGEVPCLDSLSLNQSQFRV